jgi:hypothetical protein
MLKWIQGSCVAAALTSTQLLCSVAVPETAMVDVALVLAIDCSFSVDSFEFRLQMEGLGRALQDEAVLDGISQGPNKKVAILALQWSDADNQRVVLPWTIVADAESATTAGTKLQSMPRRLAEGGTSIASALAVSFAQFEAAPRATRQVIDLSTDGRNNVGPPLPPLRNMIVASGVTINALAIINEFPQLDEYAERQIVGGPGNFVIKANSYDDYYAAMLRKLVREIQGPGTT